MTGARIQRLEDENAALISTLSEIADQVAQELAERVQRCRHDRLHRRAWPVATYVEALRAGPQFKCKAIACWACRKAHVLRKKREAALLFEDASNSDCSLLTINAAAPVASLDEVNELHRQFRFGWNNLRDGAARHDRRFERTASYALLEVQHDGAEWRPHWHILIHHPRIDRQEIADLARERWAGARRVQVKAFHADKTVIENVERCVGYATKFRHAAWSEFASASLFLWLRKRRALRSMCSATNPKDCVLSPRVRPMLLDKDEPMPVLVEGRCYSGTWSH